MKQLCLIFFCAWIGVLAAFGQSASLNHVRFQNLGTQTPQAGYYQECYPLIGPISYGIKIDYSGFTTANLGNWFGGSVKVIIESDYIVTGMNSFTAGTPTSFVTKTVTNGSFSHDEDFVTLVGEDIRSDSEFKFHTTVIPIDTAGAENTDAKVELDNFHYYTVYFKQDDFDLQADITNYSSINGNLYIYCNDLPDYDVSNSDCVAGYKYDLLNSDQSGTVGSQIISSGWAWNISGINTMNYPGTSLTSGNYYIARLSGYKSNGSHEVITKHFYYSSNNETMLNASPTDIEMCEDGNEVISASGWSGSYTWSPATYLDSSTGNSVTFTGTQPGNYVLTVSATGVNDLCVTPAQVAVTVHPEPVVSTNTGIFFCENEMPYDFNNEVSVTPSGIQGNYVWPTSTGWIGNGIFDHPGGGSGVSGHSGTYLLKYVSQEGCESETVDLDIDWNENPEPNEVVTNTSCSYTADGEIVLLPDVASSPYTVSWSNSATTNTISSLPQGFYTVTITDQEACSSVNTFFVDSPIPLSTSLTGTTNAPCSNASMTNNQGSASFIFSGGTPPYSFSMDGGAFFTPSGSGTHTHSLTSGGHTWNVMDANGCYASFGEPIPFTVEANVTFDFEAGFPQVTDATCTGLNDGAIDVSLSVTGGATPYSILYEKSPSTSFGPTSNTSHSFTGLGAGSSHLLTITEQTNGCQLATGFVNVGNAIPTPFTVGFNPVVEPGCTGLDDGEITADASVAASYVWNTGATSQTITGLVDGGYTVTATQTAAGATQGCKVTESTTLDPDDDRWQQRTEATNGEIAHRVITDDDENVYVLGNFSEEATFGETTIQSNTTSLTYFLAKYDECGNFLWASHADMNGTAMELSAVDVELHGGSLYVFLYSDKDDYSSLDIFSTDPGATSSQINPTSSGSAEFTIVLEIDPSDGSNTAMDDFASFNYFGDDQINDVEHDGSDFYVAGHVDDKAEIHSYTFGNNSTTMQITNTFTGMGSNTFHDIEFDENGNLYGVGNTNEQLNFGMQTMTNASVDEGFIMSANSSFVPQAVTRAHSGEHSCVALEYNSANEYLMLAGATVNAALNNMYVVAKKTDLSTQWTSEFDASSSNASAAEAVDLVHDADGRLVALGAFTGELVAINANGSGVTVEGDNADADLWIGGFNASTGQCDWLLAGESGETITPIALGAGSSNTYAVGGFLDDIDFYMSQEPDMAHASATTSAMFAIRFGTLYNSGAEAEFYKTQESAVNETQFFSAQPNPVQDRLILTWPSIEGTATLRIFDLSGQVVRNVSLNAALGTDYVPFTDIPTGVYLLEMVVNGQAWQHKVVKY